MSCTIAIDRGGTFTDVVATFDDGRVVVRKVPTDPPDSRVDSAIDAIRTISGVAPGVRIPRSAVRSVRCGTTAATNALLTRRGEPFALFVTRGFADLLAIGTQERPDLFALRIVKPAPLHRTVVEVDERVLADGTVRTPLDEEGLRSDARRIRAEGLTSAAVLFVHSYARPEHEATAGRILREEGFSFVSLSHEVAREIKALSRGETACADACLTPVLRRSLARFAAEFEDDVDVRFLESHGGLADARHASGPRAVLSGPAGGALAVAEIARLAGEREVVGFDMGGTSTDVGRFAGELELAYETRVAGIRLAVPSVRIVTVAAGGGSILAFDGRRFLAGPQSAGASPGPAGYGRGGPPTVTDADAVLGRVVPEAFPRCFGENGVAPFDVEASRAAIAPLARAAAMSVEDAAAGFVRVADERMAQAIREVSELRGYDLREHALVCFGGAGPQHACTLARELGVRSVLLHPLSGVLSAWGLAFAEPAHEAAEAVLRRLDDDGHAHAEVACERLGAAARAVLGLQAIDVRDVRVDRTLELRVVGVDATIAVPLESLDSTRDAFRAAHRRLYGFDPEGEIEIVNARVRAHAPSAPPAASTSERAAPVGLPATRRAWFETSDGLRAFDAPIVPLARAFGAAIRGPALVVDALTTIVVEPDFVLEPAQCGLLALRAIRSPAASGTSERTPVGTTLFANTFMSIAERMGAVLERTSHSTNIKERLDFSCAVFDEEGRLVANAPHIPVHLGAMGESVRAIVATCGRDLRDGDVIVTNDPYRGGSHLPDVTAVTPVLVAHGKPRFFVANRAHHADVGGIAPGSMPPLSRSLDEEGACIHGLRLVRGGVFLAADALAAFGAGPHPTRAPRERLADLRAQAAANAEGARLLGELCARHGEDLVAAFMEHVLDDGAAAMEERIAELPPGPHVIEDALDDGTPLRVAVSATRNRIVVDFAGTGPRSPGNLNAPHAVTRAAVLYALRTLIRREIPLNEGCLRPVEIRIPPGSLLDPEPPAAVVGGNVETSMRLVDLVLGALGACAASQGTMNNTTFGTEERAYYETLGGGAGAGREFDGASAVQLHMTNTRITDVEVLETRFPVVGSSRVDLQACKLEYSIVSPK